MATTYNFVTVWYYLGMAGFPDGAWLFAEILVELIMVFDFLTVTLLRERMPNQWRTMWLLQGKSETHVWLSMTAQAAACFPQSLVFMHVFRHDKGQLATLLVAGLRALKLL